MLMKFLCKRNLLLQICRNSNRLLLRNYARKVEEAVDEPIPYTKSLANQWQAKSSRIGRQGESRLWYEPYVILGSIAVFLIYFCVLREENHIDLELNRSLYSRIEGLEEHQLRLSLQHYETIGKDTTDIRKRLQELEAMKAESVQ